MKSEVRGKPDYAVVRVTFEAKGERVLAEPSAMIAMDDGVRLQTGLAGGVFKAAKRRVLGSESFFRNTFEATEAGQRVWLAPAAEGDVQALTMSSEPIFLASGAYLASTPEVDVDTAWGGARGFFSGTGAFLLRAKGAGELFVACYGGIHRVNVGPNGYVVDTGHVVGFTHGLDYRLTKVGDLKSLLFSGEGLVCEFRGAGTLWLSTRNPASLAAFLDPFRPVEGR